MEPGAIKRILYIAAVGVELPPLHRWSFLPMWTLDQRSVLDGLSNHPQESMFSFLASFGHLFFPATVCGFNPPGAERKELGVSPYVGHPTGNLCYDEVCMHGEATALLLALVASTPPTRYERGLAERPTVVVRWRVSEMAAQLGAVVKLKIRRFLPSSAAVGAEPTRQNSREASSKLWSAAVHKLVETRGMASKTMLCLNIGIAADLSRPSLD